MKKILILMLMALTLVGCFPEGEVNNNVTDSKNTLAIGHELAGKQPTPTDIDYSLERFNLIKRAYWVNGQRDKALALKPGVPLPLGYIVLFSGSTIVGQFSVEGKVSSLNSFLTPDSEAYEVTSNYSYQNDWLPDVDGSYGMNDNGVFFFTPDGKYVEWSGEYMYSDMPIFVENPVIKIAE